MKTSMFFLRTLALTILLTGTFTWSYSQTKNTVKLTQKAAVPTVDLKVYEVCKGRQTLLVYNPLQHSFFYYQTAPFSVQWFEDDVLVGQGTWLENVCGQSFTAVITNDETGWTKSITYTMNCGGMKE